MPSPREGPRDLSRERNEVAKTHHPRSLRDLAAALLILASRQIFANCSSFEYMVFLNSLMRRRFHRRMIDLQSCKESSQRDRFQSAASLGSLMQQPNHFSYKGHDVCILAEVHQHRPPTSNL